MSRHFYLQPGEQTKMSSRVMLGMAFSHALLLQDMRFGEYYAGHYALICSLLDGAGEQSQ